MLIRAVAGAILIWRSRNLVERLGVWSRAIICLNCRLLIFRFFLSKLLEYLCLLLFLYLTRGFESSVANNVSLKSIYS